jgi:catalase
VNWKTQLTAEAGIPVGDNQNSVTAGLRGPGLPWTRSINAAKDGEKYGRK